MFGDSVRHTGVPLGYQLGAVAGGAFAPIIATALYAEYGTTNAIAVYLAIVATLSFVSVALVRTHQVPAKSGPLVGAPQTSPQRAATGRGHRRPSRGAWRSIHPLGDARVQDRMMRNTVETPLTRGPKSGSRDSGIHGQMTVAVLLRRPDLARCGCCATLLGYLAGAMIRVLA